jgi:hypothetical protein
MTKDEKLRSLLEIPTPQTMREMAHQDTLEAWAHYGKTLDARLSAVDLPETITMILLKSKTQGEMVRRIRMYLLTGAKR